MKKTKITLRAQSVTKAFGNNPVLSDIDLQLNAGEWLGVLGESGSGKSTLLRILGRFLDAEQGKIYFKEEELKPVSGELIPGHESIKLIHQEFELFPNQTVEENIAYSLRFYETVYRKEKVAELMTTAGLDYVRNQKAKLLSGGEKQRTAIAKALAEQPDVLLLDEPFAHLDNHNRRVLGNAIETMRNQQKMSCIFVTHEAADALAWSDRIAVLRNGKIIQTGTPQEVYNQPVDSYVAELTGDINWLSGKDGSKDFFIRPEKIKPTKHPEKSKWQGKVEAIRFHGNHWEIRCINGDDRLAFYRNRLDLEIGQQVFLTYAAKDLRSI
ncbi:ABC transporter ATP-binding protein [Dyadobacter pollutisoli]|jgi:iron(III) transport system ATP-binding protein|uniref:ABC transporter ATP-binding protein n=1 Tax=Dyadobacter pollutisoli TaxID=2910158 RepID=A0A9E8SIB4_9BACT|nr:ABC transporter ATP-binding protein [Dyadobacter pollutisoli]WAC09558.1 ABC transporter ATP-binding protein [Dyadobacter pollutisoli]